MVTFNGDHLVDAREAYEQAGPAQHAATDDFGKLDEIAPDYQAELNLAQGHRTAAAALTLAASRPIT